MAQVCATTAWAGRMPSISYSSELFGENGAKTISFASEQTGKIFKAIRGATVVEGRERLPAFLGSLAGALHAPSSHSYNFHPLGRSTWFRFPVALILTPAS